MIMQVKGTYLYKLMVGKLMFMHLKSKKLSDVNPIGKGNTTKYHLCAETPCAALTLKV